ncbi:TetR/AcrR family transcriptional regulator [Brevundimonas sp. FT23042]|uniref:TetR/AcrR family transcriptional regulator n=1 Tax=Brevundimonas sp. FT23042 TaxID=3393749 RepID=UPI003B58A4F4
MATPPALLEAQTRVNRKVQKAATRAALLQVAVDLLIEKGVAGVTTLEVQIRAGVSRGALLHHFPSRSDLLSATVTELVGRNEAALWREQARQPVSDEPVASAIRTLARTASTSSYVAEMELWTVSRTDPVLRETLRSAERRALPERERVLDALFESLRDHPARAQVIDLTTEFARGLALSNLLRDDPRTGHALVESWIGTVGLIIAATKSVAG